MTEHVLGSGFGHLLWWGPEHVQIYNDAYRPILGTKHPQALGQRSAECFAEIWDIIGPMIERPYHGGLPSTMEDLDLDLNRYGFAEETHFSVSYSPVLDSSVPGGIGGVLATVQETTQQVLSSRRMQLVRDLGAATAGAVNADEAAQAAADALAGAPRDVVYAHIYLLDHETKQARIAGDFGDPAPKTTLSFTELEQQIGKPLSRLKHATYTGRNADPVSDGRIAVPLAVSREGEPAGIMFAGASPRHALDDAYLSFFDVIAAPISAALRNSQAYDTERERARALQELDTAKNEFFSNISHEFRTPLTLMLLPLEDLARADDPEQRDLAEQARRNALRLLKLVNHLLEFSRLQAGRSDVAYVRTDLAQLTRHLIGVFGSAFDSAGLKLDIDIDLNEPVFVDRSMWERIFLNLISNAIKFTFEGTVTVSLTKDGGCAQLVVRDTGVGVPADEIPRLFERFHRVRNVESRSHEGSGIGLALVKDLVELHGGTISVQSTEGKGTAFTVRIPLGSGHLDAEKIVSESEAEGYASAIDQYIADLTSTMRLQQHDMQPQTAEPASAKRVLLADDNIDLLDYLQGALGKRYRVTCVRDGIEALDALRAGHYDVVVSDVMMPRMDGFELLRQIRHDEELRSTPFIMLSARAGESAAVEGLAAGADDYLTKPFKVDDLLARIYAQIQGTAMRLEAMERLKKSEDRFRTLTSSLPSIAVETDASGAVTFLSDSFTRYTGVSTEDGYGDRWMRVLHPDDAGDFAQQWRAHVQAGEPFEREMRMRQHDGAYRWHYVRAIPHRDESGAIVRWTGTATDIHESRRALEERELLAEASQIFSQPSGLTDTLRAIARFAVHRVADWCQIDLKTADGGIQTVAIAHRDPEKDAVAQGLIGRIHLNPDAQQGTPKTIRTGQSELVPEVTLAMLENAIPDDDEIELYRELGITSGISVPLNANGETLGAFSFVISSSNRKFSQDDLPITEELGRRAALAVQRAEAYDREHRVADSFQRASLPPTLPSVPGVKFDAVYVAGSSEAQVGGDWYDAVRLLDGRLVVSIGDVAGSGLGAAVTMGNMRQIIRGIAQVHADPSLMLDAADR
ncbi:MAG TPA: ATP-binding protein, partial [Candidatus Baltobacteraceae bacterium]|nr:ATP-binding protein [Candidatus Baltobacteraceae bacterium]